MMFRAEKAALVDALSAAGQVVKNNDSIPLLQNVIIERDGDGLVARGTNMDIEISGHFAAQITADFEPFTCRAQTFGEFVRNAPASEIDIEAIRLSGKLSAVMLRSGRSRLRVSVLPAGDFPKMTDATSHAEITMMASSFKSAISAVRYAADTAADRPFLCGVLLQGRKDGLEFVATDGKQLQRRLIPALAFDEETDLLRLPGVIIGSALADRLVKILDGEEDITLRLSSNKLSVIAGSVIVTGKLIEGQYPDWRGILPQDHDILCGFSGEQLIDAVGRVLLATPDSGNGVSLTIRDGDLSLWAQDMNAGGEAEDTIAAECDRDHEVGLHGRQVQEALRHLPKGRMEMTLGGDNTRILIRSPGDVENFAVLQRMFVKGFRPSHDA